MENDILTAARDTLQADADLTALVAPRAIFISEGGDIEASTPMPAIALASGSISYKPRGISGTSEFVTFEVVAHCYLEQFKTSGPERASAQLKTLAQHVKRILFRNKLGIAIFNTEIGSIVFPSYGQRNYVDRYEARVSVMYTYITT